ncbi:hypothetical protein AAMO2058_001005500 [Amorphochlora amoebiformis]
MAEGVKQAIDEKERIRRAIQKSVQKYARELSKEGSLDKKERRKTLKEFRIKEQRKHRIAKNAQIKSESQSEQSASRATEWRKKTFGERDKRYLDSSKREQKQLKFQTAAEKGSKHDIVIIPIFWKNQEEQKARAVSASNHVKKHLHQAGLDTWIDQRHKYTPGQKFAYWEHIGVCMRVEIGPKDLEKNTCTLRFSPEAGKVGSSLGNFSITGNCHDLIRRIHESRISRGKEGITVPKADMQSSLPNIQSQEAKLHGMSGSSMKSSKKRKHVGDRNKRVIEGGYSGESMSGAAGAGESSIKRKKAKKKASTVVKF